MHCRTLLLVALLLGVADAFAPRLLQQNQRSVLLSAADNKDTNKDNNNSNSIGSDNIFYSSIEIVNKAATQQQRRLTRIIKYPFRKVRNFFRRDNSVFKELEKNRENLIRELEKNRESVQTDYVKPLQQYINVGGGSSSKSKTATTEKALPVVVVDANSVTSKQAVKEMTVTGEQESAATTTAVATAERSLTGSRWAVAAPNVDLTGNWKLIADDKFKADYEKYLILLGQPLLVRSVALGVIGFTTEEITMTDQGRNLVIKGRNVRGVWDRTLVASGIDRAENSDSFTPVLTPMETADGEEVMAESWWEQDGTVHRSWLSGVKKYGGGAFESQRYLTDDGNTYICESTFHPDDESREKAKVVWKFERADELPEVTPS